MKALLVFLYLGCGEVVVVGIDTPQATIYMRGCRLECIIIEVVPDFIPQEGLLLLLFFCKGVYLLSHIRVHFNALFNGFNLLKHTVFTLASEEEADGELYRGSISDIIKV